MRLSPRNRTPRFSALRIALLYALLSVFWILFSDSLVSLLLRDTEMFTRVQSIKGTLFVLASALLIYVLVRNALSKAYESELRIHKSEERFRAVARVSGVGVWEDNQGHAPEYLNTRMFTMLGYDPLPAGQGLPFIRSLRHEEDGTILDRLMRGLVEGERQDVDYICRFRHREGSLVHLRVRAHVVARDNAGRPERIIGSHEDVTEREVEHLSVLESEERLRAMASGMPVLLFAMDEAQQLVEWNDECVRVTGYSAEEMIRNPDFLLKLYPEDAYRERVLASWGGGSEDYRDQIWTITTKAGDRRVIAWSSVGNTIRIPGWSQWGIGVDITPRMRALERLAASEARRNAAERTAQVGTFDYDIRSEQGQWSPQMYINCGFPVAELPPTFESWLSRVHPEDRGRLQAAALAVMSEQVDLDESFRIQMPDGALRYLRARATLELDEGGVPRTALGTIQDVTALEEATRALAESREVMDLAIRGTGAGTWDVHFNPKSPDLVTAFYMSPEAKALVGYGAEEALDDVQAWTALIHPEDLARVSMAVARQMQEGDDEFEYQYRIRHRDGSYRWLSFRGRMRRNSENLPVRWTGLIWDITDRKRIEEELILNRARLDSILRSAPVGIALVLNRIIVWISHAFGDLLGRDERTLVGGSTRAFYESDAEFVRVGKLLYGQLDTEPVGSVQTAFVRPDGTRRHVLLRATRFQEDDPDSPVTVTALDISDLEQARHDRLESEARYRHLFESANDAIFLLEGQDVVDVNAQGERMLGLTKEALKGRSPLELAPTYQSEGLPSRAVASDVLERAASGEHQTFDWCYLTESKALRYAEISLSPLAAPFEHWSLIIARDITERRESEARMRQLSLAVNQSPVAVIITDAAGAIEYVNPSFEQTTGWTLEEVAGKNPQLLSSGRTARAMYDELWTCISGGEIWRGVFENRRKDGSEYFASATIAPLRDETGEIINYIGLQEDVTELRESEERQQQLEDQYRQAQKMEAIGTLAGGIAHDFNNILAAILGYVELAQTDVERSSSVYSDLERIHEAGLRARDLVQQILTFSRMTEQSRLPIRVDLIFKETMKLLRSTLPASVKVKIDFEHTEDTVLADSTQMHQLMLNLVTNAYQAIEESGTVTVRFRKIDTDDELLAQHAGLVAGSYVRLEVIDTGVGIAPENLERIFDPFFTTKEQGKGTGLGLATTHGIVKSHGGVIDVVSDPGEGTTFTIFLPCVEEPPEQTVEPPVELPGGREHVLAVDDEGALARLLARRLRGLGYEVTVLEDPLEALEAFKASPSSFSLLLTDQQMPGMTGVQLAQACWRVRSDVPAVIMTGYSESLTPERALEVGFSEMLSKPVTLMTLAEAVREAIDAHRRKTQT